MVVHVELDVSPLRICNWSSANCMVVLEWEILKFEFVYVDTGLFLVGSIAILYPSKFLIWWWPKVKLMVILVRGP